MREHIDLTGASGAVYRFSLVREGRPLSPMGGEFLYVRAAGESHEVLLIGEVGNLMTDARGRWDEAAADHGAEHLFTRLNVTERIRQQEHADILAAAHPPMNGQAAKGPRAAAKADKDAS